MLNEPAHLTQVYKVTLDVTEYFKKINYVLTFWIMLEFTAVWSVSFMWFFLVLIVLSFVTNSEPHTVEIEHKHLTHEAWAFDLGELSNCYASMLAYSFRKEFVNDLKIHIQYLTCMSTETIETQWWFLLLKFPFDYINCKYLFFTQRALCQCSGDWF